MANISIDEFMKHGGVSFGTSGIRGLAEELTDRMCYVCALAFLQYAVETVPAISVLPPQERLVAISGDLRPSTSRIIRAIVRASQDQGFVPLDCGRFPTPALALYAFGQQIPAIMVTGSHVAENRNGMKFLLPHGEILKSDEEAIRHRQIEWGTDLFEENGDLLTEHYPQWGATDRGAVAQAYYMRYIDTFPENCLAGFRIGFLAHSSVASDILGDLYESFGAEVVRFGRIDKFLAIDTEAVSLELSEFVKQWAVTGRFDAIFSADGDGDRPLVFDENGEFIPGDITGIVTAMFLDADSVVTPITSNTILESAWGGAKIFRTKVGSPHVIAGMEQAVREGGKSVVGYEANGGFMIKTPVFLAERFKKMGFKKPPRKSVLAPLPTRDPAIVHLAMLLDAAQKKNPLSVFHRMFSARVTRSGRLTDFPASLAGEKLDQLQLCDAGQYPFVNAQFSRFGTLTSVDFTDGVRMTFDEKNIIHLRASGNAPEFRCYIETEQPELAQKLLYDCLEIMDSWR